MNETKILDVTGRVFLTDRTWGWCILPYPGHTGKHGEPLGCPNFGVKEGCPPQIPWIWESADLEGPIYLVVVVFDLGAHKRRMLLKHPDWSDRQASCCLYWQKSVVNQLELFSRKLITEYPKLRYTLCPEAQGVNVVRTAKGAGLPLEVKPQKLVHKIALLYQPKEASWESAKKVPTGIMSSLNTAQYSAMGDLVNPPVNTSLNVLRKTACSLTSGPLRLVATGITGSSTRSFVH